METHFDVLILGTGLTQSIVAAALAKAGIRVLHVDTNPHYGGDQASLSHEELLQWSSSPPSSVSAVVASSSSPLPFSRSYSLSLAPAIIPSSGPLIASLILSGVSRYGQFKLLDAVYIFRQNSLHRVPGNKEDIFKARDVTLIDKRKLMRFLQFAAGEFENAPELQEQETISLASLMRDKFSLSDEAVEAILYALAYCSSPTEPALPALIRLRQYLRSSGRYGNSPFLVGHYGGLGEVAQGFCRTCAVNAGIYILGRKMLNLQLPTGSETVPSEAGRASIQLEDVPDVLTADVVITASEYLPSDLREGGPTYACCIAITNKPISAAVGLEESSKDATEGDSNEQVPPDTAIVVFPPGSLPGGRASEAVRVLQMGEATLSCPRGKWESFYILYLSTRTEEAPEAVLGPYLSTVMAPNGDESKAQNIEFSLFYKQRESDAPVLQQQRTLVVPRLRQNLPEIADQAAQDAEAIFWDAVQMLARPERVESFWPAIPPDDDDAAGEEW